MTSYSFLLIAIFSAVTSQLLTKFQMQRAGVMPEDLKSQLLFLISNLFTFPVILAIILTFVSGLSWLGALSKFSLTEAYPFMLLTFPVVAVSSHYFFGDPLSSYYLVGGIFIMVGLVLISR